MMVGEMGATVLGMDVESLVARVAMLSAFLYIT
jgi:hypothetical protein